MECQMLRLATIGVRAEQLPLSILWTIIAGVVAKFHHARR
jgi:hypothetical protein